MWIPILISGLSMGLKLWSILELPEYKDFIQINKSDEIIEVNFGSTIQQEVIKHTKF